MPGGKVESARIEYTVKTDAEFRSVEDLESAGGGVDRRSGRVSLRRGPRRGRRRGPDTIAQFNGKPTVGIGVRKQSGANTVAVVDEIYRRMDAIAPTLPPGMTFVEKEGAADFSKAIRESVDETIFALVFGALLATLTVFVFLRRTRPTLIVAVAIPISLVATFGVMWLLDYTLNTMTLLALALAVGVVIDDAIVVLENIERHREEGESPHVAASLGTKQIAFAATAATVAIAVVFLPVVFVQGIVGSFLKEFGVSVGTRSDDLAVGGAHPHADAGGADAEPKERAHGSIYQRLERAFDALESGYKKPAGAGPAPPGAHPDRRAPEPGGDGGIRQRAGFLGGEFFPPSDNGMFFTRFETPPGTTLETTLEYLRQNEKWVLEQPELAGLFAGVGIGRHRSKGDPSQGMMFAILKSKKERERTTQELVPLARQMLKKIPGQEVRVFDLSNMLSVNEGDFAFEIRGNVELAHLNDYANEFTTGMEAAGGYVDLQKSLRLGFPRCVCSPTAKRRRRSASTRAPSRPRCRP